MADWLNKILIKAKETFNLEDKDVQKIEEQISDVQMTGLKNTVDAKILQKNNGNVPIAGSWGNPPPEGEIEGFTLFKNNQKSQTQQFGEQPTNFVEINHQQQVEQRVNTMAQQLQQQNKFAQFQQNNQVAEGEKQKKLPNGIENIVYNDGTATIKKKDGTTFKRPAINGEPGYKKDGESMEERLNRFFGEKIFNDAKTPEAKAKLLEQYFEDYYKGMTKSQGEKEKLQFQDFMKLMKNTGMNSDYGQIMGRSLHSLYKNNKIEAFEGGLKLSNTQAATESFTNGVISDIGLSGDDSKVQKTLLEKTSIVAAQNNFQSTYVLNLTQNYGQVNPNNAPYAANQAYKLDANSANTGFKALLDKSESTEATVRANPQLNQAVKAQLGNDFEITSVKGEQINACSKTICHMINTGDIQGAQKLFSQNQSYLGDSHKEAIALESTNFAVGGKGKIEERQAAAQLTVTATTKIDDKDKQLDVATSNNKKFAEAEKGVKESYLVANGEKLADYDEENQLKVDEQLRKIDTEEQIYTETAAEYGHLLAVQNQKEFVQRTVDSGNEEASQSIAEHSYEYDVSNREDVIKMLKEQGYESTMKALDEAKAKYESETVQKSGKKPEETKTQSDEAKVDTATNTSTAKPAGTGNISGSATLMSNQKIENIISNSSTNTTEKAKQIKGLSTKEQEQAIEKLMENASLPEIKGYILSGLKSEVISYLLKNFDDDSRSKIDSIKYLMTSSDLERYNKLIDAKKEEKQIAEPKTNFFMS